MNECSLCALLVIASQKERLAHRMLQEVWTIIIIIVSSDSDSMHLLFSIIPLLT